MQSNARPADGSDRGQILVIFALGLVAMIAMVGLVLDGGDTFAQRRSQQNAADMAAIAGANAYMNQSGSATAKRNAATAAARAAATRNGYTRGRRHHRGRSGAQAAVVRRGDHRERHGAAPEQLRPRHGLQLLGRVGDGLRHGGRGRHRRRGGAVDHEHRRLQRQRHAEVHVVQSRSPSARRTATTRSAPTDLAWTDFNGANNVNTNEVRRIIEGSNVVTATIEFEQYIGQHNQGNHTALYSDVNSNLAGKNVPIPIVGPCPAGQPAGHTGRLLQGLGDVPRRQRVRRQQQDDHGLLPVQLHPAAAHRRRVHARRCRRPAPAGTSPRTCRSASTSSASRTSARSPARIERRPSSRDDGRRFRVRLELGPNPQAGLLDAVVTGRRAGLGLVLIPDPPERVDGEQDACGQSEDRAGDLRQPHEAGEDVPRVPRGEEPEDAGENALLHVGRVGGHPTSVAMAPSYRDPGPVVRIRHAARRAARY